MVSPLTFGLNPQQLERAKEVGRYVSVRFTKHRREGRLIVEFIPKGGGVDPAAMVDGMVESMATQLYNFFGIGGEILDVE